MVTDGSGSVRLVLEIIFTLALVFFILEEVTSPSNAAYWTIHAAMQFYQLYYVHESNFKSYFFAGKYAPLGRIIESVQAPSKQSNRSRWLSIILNIMVVAFWLTFIFNEERQVSFFNLHRTLNIPSENSGFSRWHCRARYCTSAITSLHIAKRCVERFSGELDCHERCLYTAQRLQLYHLHSAPH